MELDIKDISGKLLLTTIPNEGCKRKFTLMKEDYILLRFSLENPIYFKLGSYAECKFGLFELCDLQNSTSNNGNAGYDYELQLDAYYWKWKNKIFKYTPETAGQEASWNLTASLDVQAGIVLRNLKALGYTYRGKDFVFSIDSTVENKSHLMSYDNINILDACFEMAKKWDCECWVTENIIHFGRCEFGTAVDFEIAKNVEDMSRSDSQSTYATRIYAFGSTKNIPTNYRPVDETVVVNGVVQKRLMLPVGTPYIDAYPNMRIEEAIEQVVTFDDVYPRRVGTVSDIATKEYTDTNEDTGEVTKWNAYRFKDTGIAFSKDYILSGEELKITFQSGKLNGMMFAVTFDPDGKDEQLWEIIRNEDYGRPLPDGVLIPENDDTYILSGWDSTKIEELGLVSIAEQELETEAKKYVAKSKIDPNTYTCRMDPVYIYGINLETGEQSSDFAKHFDVGDRVNLINKAYFENSRQSRIIGFEYNLDIPYDHPIYTVGETASYSRIGKIEDKIEELTLKGQTYTGGNGSSVYVIGTNDKTTWTNRNVLSALRVKFEFISKLYDDTVRGVLTFLKGIYFGHFVKGTTGAGIYKDENENWHIEGDYFHVRKKLTAEEVEIQRNSHIGGKLTNTSANGVCVDVEEYEDFYRCYFLKSDADGRTVYNEFRVDDQAYVETFNLQKQADGTLGNHFWWRLVVGVDDDTEDRHFMDLSKTDCAEGSDIPKAGDDISQLGNRTDKTRQGAHIMSAVGEGAPYYRIYNGINSYTLPEPKIDLSPEESKICAKFISEATGKDFDEALDALGADVEAIKKQSDRQYIIWFGTEIPTLLNYPAMDWQEADYATHVEDLFYLDNETDEENNGRAWRFQLQADGETYAWNEVTDKFVLQCLKTAAEAKKEAQSKKRVFVSQPTDDLVYDVGDLWTNATYKNADGSFLYEDDTLVCKVAKAAGEPFNINHWKPANYATKANIINTGESIRLEVQASIDAVNDSLAALEVTVDTIEASVQKVHFDASGNIINIDKTGLLLESDFASLLAEKIIFDASGNITNIDKSGLVLESDFASLFVEKVIHDAAIVEQSGLVLESNFATIFAAAVDADGNIVKQAQISAFVTMDDVNGAISNLELSADQINFIGKTIINGNFEVDLDGNLTLNNVKANNITAEGTIKAGSGSKIGNMQILSGGSTLGQNSSFINAHMVNIPYATNVIDYSKTISGSITQFDTYLISNDRSDLFQIKLPSNDDIINGNSKLHGNGHVFRITVSVGNFFTNASKSIRIVKQGNMELYDRNGNAVEYFDMRNGMCIMIQGIISSLADSRKILYVIL